MRPWFKKETTLRRAIRFLLVDYAIVHGLNILHIQAELFLHTFILLMNYTSMDISSRKQQWQLPI